MLQRNLTQDKLSIFLVTCPTIDMAKKISYSLIENRLAACVNIIPSIRSIYRWNDNIQDDAESLLFIKTESSRFLELTNHIKSMHSYDIPEIIELPIKYAEESYAKWVLNELIPTK